MIFGIGTDVVRIERIAAAYERFGAHFVERLLLPQERAAFDPERRPARFLAMRFAAKEAIVKALQKVGFQGPTTLEIAGEEAVKTSAARLRQWSA